MGYLNFEKEPHHLKRITGVLQRRGLRPVLDEEWEIHGPHEWMNYQVYVGYAQAKDDPTDCPCVVIYPRGVYEIDDLADWNKPLQKRRFPYCEKVGELCEDSPRGRGITPCPS